MIHQVEVGVVNPPILIESIIKIGPTSSILKNGSLEAVAKGGKSPLKYEWFKDGQKIGTDKKLEGVSIGIYNLIVTDSAGCNIKLNSIFLQVASSNEDEEIAGINIFPNPASDYITIENKSGFAIDAISIFNITGQMVYHVKATRNESNIEINTSQFNKFNSGLYQLIMTINGNNISRKILFTN